MVEGRARLLRTAVGVHTETQGRKEGGPSPLPLAGGGGGGPVTARITIYAFEFVWHMHNVVKCDGLTERLWIMAVSAADIKLLWGRAAGLCSRPGCGVDLTSLPEGKKAYSVGEMAHVIARSAAGPRGNGLGGDDSYDNLVLLCPTCHRHVDKSEEGTFPADLLFRWKADHEKRVAALGTSERYQTNEDLCRAVSVKLAKNYSIWKQFGPESDAARADPNSNAYDIWEIRRADSIVPNNRSIINAISANEALLNGRQIKAFAAFFAHAEAYERHTHQPIENYPRFPLEFEKAFQYGE